VGKGKTVVGGVDGDSADASERAYHDSDPLAPGVMLVSLWVALEGSQMVAGEASMTRDRRSRPCADSWLNRNDMLFVLRHVHELGASNPQYLRPNRTRTTNPRAGEARDRSSWGDLFRHCPFRC
jgi:hypothetical protein